MSATMLHIKVLSGGYIIFMVFSDIKYDKA